MVSLDMFDMFDIFGIVCATACAIDAGWNPLNGIIFPVFTKRRFAIYR